MRAKLYLLCKIESYFKSFYLKIDPNTSWKQLVHKSVINL